jgi:bleomycin hydrolase
MRKTLTLMSVALALTVSAQTGGITEQMLQQMQRQYTVQPANKALRNAIATNAIDNLAKNPANAGAMDTYFNIETKKQSIHDQKSSGRCWMFSGLNVLRANFANALIHLR